MKLLALICVNNSCALAVKLEFKRLDSVAAVGVVAVNVYSNDLARVEAVLVDLHVGNTNRGLKSK